MGCHTIGRPNPRVLVVVENLTSVTVATQWLGHLEFRTLKSIRFVI